MKWIALVVLAIFLGAGVFSIPVWKKNSFTLKQKERRELEKKKADLIQTNLILDRRVNQLANISRIEAKAENEIGLTWGQRPIEIELE